MSAWKHEKSKETTRPCTTVRDSEDILEQPPFQKYVFLALCDLVYLYLWICICVFARLTHGSIIFDSLEQSSFQKYTTYWVFLVLHHMLYLCILCMYFLYLRILHIEISFLISLNNPLFTNIPHVGSFWHFIICCICVFMYLCICISIFACLTHGNIIFDIIEQSSFQKYATWWVFTALLICCICVFVYLYLCICAWDTWKYQFWYPWTKSLPGNTRTHDGVPRGPRPRWPKKSRKSQKKTHRHRFH